jgi:hypothetical protein
MLIATSEGYEKPHLLLLRDSWTRLEWRTWQRWRQALQVPPRKREGIDCHKKNEILFER